MSQQNVNDWTDKTGKRLEIGQRICAAWGKELYVGTILWFTKSGVTMETEYEKDNRKLSVGYQQQGAYYLGPQRFYIIKDV